MVGVSFSVDSSAVRKRLDRVYAKMDSGAQLTVKEITQLTYDLLVANIPKGTGEAARSLAFKTVENRNGYHSGIVYIATTPHPDRVGRRGYNGEWFNLPRWMMSKTSHAGGWFPAYGSKSGVYVQFKSGNIDAFRKTPEAIRREFRHRIVARFRKDLK